MGRDKNIEELTVWLEADDAKGRPWRAKRLRDLLSILPLPPERMMFLGGEQSMICFDEARRCYLDGSYMAVVLLCLAYVERELAARLYAAGWDKAKNVRLAEILERAYEVGELSELEWQTYRDLANLRNSHAHFRSPDEKTSLISRTVEENELPGEMLKEDARKAVLAISGMVKRQSSI